MNKTIGVCIFLFFLFICSNVWGADKDVPNLTVALDGGVGYMVPPEIIYGVDLNNAGKNIETEGDISYNGGLVLGFRNVEISYRYDYFNDEQTGMVRNSNTGQAAGYGATGVLGDGTWDYDHKIVNHSIGIGMWSEQKNSLRPYFGFSYHNYKQEFDLNALFAGSYSSVYDTECDADFYGLKMGGEYQTKEKNGWQLILRPMLYAHYVDAEARILQDPNSTIAGLSTVTDNKNSERFSFGCSVDIGVKKYFTPNFLIGLTVGGVYIYNQPTVELPATADRAGDIIWDNAYMAVSKLELRLMF